MISLPTAVSIITFAVHTKVMKQPLSAETAFTSLSLFAVMRNPLEQLADVRPALHPLRRAERSRR